MRIDFFFDTSCPWCYIAKRRLENALASRPLVKANVNWGHFLLNPDMPMDGIPWRTFLELKFGGAQQINEVLEAIIKAGAKEDLDFNLEGLTIMPNTINSHRFICYAAYQGRQEEAVESVFRARFIELKDIGGLDVLVCEGERLGLAPGPLANYLENDMGADLVFREQANITTVLNENAAAHRIGIDGVPCLVFDEKFAISGTQNTNVYLRLIDLSTKMSRQDSQTNCIYASSGQTLPSV